MTELIVRYAHYYFGILWMATGMVNLFIISQALPRLEPPVRGKVGAELGPRFGALGGVGAIVTLLSGLWLFQRIYGEIGINHDRGGWAVASVVLGVIVFFVAMGISMPASMRLSKVMKGEAEGDIPAIMKRLKVAGFAAGLLGVLAVLCMMLAAHPFIPFGAAPLLAAAAVSLAFFFAVFFIATRFNK